MLHYTPYYNIHVRVLTLCKVTSCCRSASRATPTWDPLVHTIHVQVQPSCTSHRTREPICRSSNSDIIPQRQPVSYHQSYFLPSTQDAEPVSPLVDIPPLSQANTPPNLQMPSPPVCRHWLSGCQQRTHLLHDAHAMFDGPQTLQSPSFRIFCVLKGR